MSKAKQQTLIERVCQEVGQYPSTYDAHKDRLADEWDIRESLNKALTLLREVDATKVQP